ncbi:AraC family transcriptional regulator [Agrobacterium fabrum]|jgi:AraC-like DNA-binding protein|uniref:Transcriptional regulator, AraC family n=1 Tax=Agrobacterium fabrum (strain C58 / ATCC 33970) TaxID=176299 RepID=A9CLF9_AGRFC|nr:AraC family transcriptional regulator [Agrobacterium fabrum]KEY54341.1 AraC family transcriptional regulator [Agrobacterium tumefaciens]AAK90651.1 transcriptional regulator, AraC family [Agrobacterium fabrum str. C58]KJX90379.1 putative araC-like transcription regulator [Agrobacterium tumefaciens]MCX2875473.1 AraC family transcriptional regulator [Agrobacterium fabrum]NMV70623.1 helix-turn-helix transcriptional regulator [Agrobacterium fabrum]
MTDPIAEVVSLLKPSPSISKLVTGGGRWRVERTELGSPFYCAVVEGRCLLTVAGKAPIVLTTGDFVLVPEIFSFTMSSIEPPPRGALLQRLETSPGVFRLGDPDAPVEIKAMVGHCLFGSDDKTLLVSLLPEIIHVRGEQRLALLVQMINDETGAERTAREMVLGRLLEVLLIEVLRSTGGASAPPGLLRGMADPQLAPTLRRIHEDPGRNMTVEGLAQFAAMSRSTFFERFRREVGVAPMEYATGWRMALAKELLRKDVATAEIAQRVGYGSASAFSVAFSRHVGQTPGAYSRAASNG